MKHWHAVLPLVLAGTLVAASADARPLAISKQFETEKKLGFGVALGVPSGIVGKFFLTQTLAVDVGAGAYFLYRDRDGFHIHADFLWHPFVAVEGESFFGPLYFGAGFRLLRYDDFTHSGVRVPIGISFDFFDKPFDVFLESAFIYDLAISEGASGAVDINAMVGVRYFL